MSCVIPNQPGPVPPSCAVAALALLPSSQVDRHNLADVLFGQFQCFDLVRR